MNKKQLIVAWAIVLLPFSTIIDEVEARSGCCSHHGGVCGSQCCDGTPLSEKCAPYYPESEDTSEEVVQEKREEVVEETGDPEVRLEDSQRKYENDDSSDEYYSSDGSGFLDSLFEKKSNFASKRENEKTYYKVAKVVNGIKLKLDYDLFVSLIGVSTLDIKADKAKQLDLNNRQIRKASKKASDFLRSLAGGKYIRIEFDKQKHDKKGNTVLGYVYLEDGTFVNAELIREGLAIAYSQPPNTENDEIFSKLEQEAKENKRGFWSNK